MSDSSKRPRSPTLDQTLENTQPAARRRISPVDVPMENLPSTSTGNDSLSVEGTAIRHNPHILEAVRWLQENPTKTVGAAARAFNCHRRSVSTAYHRTLNQTRNIRGETVTHGGHNKVLTEAQEQAILQYCRMQYDMGLGATKRMVLGAVKHICTTEGKKEPSWSWFTKWLKNNTALHSLKTKPIERARLESHSEKDVEDWYQGYRAALAKYKITKGKQLLNMDESGARVGCPTGEEVVVPTEVTDLYAPSPENRKSVTIFETVYADGREPLPPFVVCPGVKVMDTWIHENLTGNKRITTSPTGYTNDTVVMDYLDHLIFHTKASNTKPWKLLLLDGHITHEYPDFVIKANDHHIALHIFPSHLTHALQPLDVGIFRPWKHYHNKAIQSAVRNLDFEYTVSSFFENLTSVRKDTMKPHTIKNAFRNSGMWPVSAKAGIAKMRHYAKSTKVDKKRQHRPGSPKLPTNPISQSEHALTEWIERDPTTLSSPSRVRYTETLKSAKVQLNYAHLIDTEYQMMHTRLKEDQKRRTNSRKSLHKGGAISVDAARKKRLDRDQKEKDDAIRKVETAIKRQENKAAKKLKARGILARKEEKNRKKTRSDLLARGEELPFGIDVPIRDPEKDPTQAEQEALRANISLIERLNELRPPTETTAPSVLGQEERQIDEETEEEREPTIVTEVVEEADRFLPGNWEDSSEGAESDEIESGVDSSDAASCLSIDSIARNADFVGFD